VRCDADRLDALGQWVAAAIQAAAADPFDFLVFSGHGRHRIADAQTLDLDATAGSGDAGPGGEAGHWLVGGVSGNRLAGVRRGGGDRCGGIGGDGPGGIGVANGEDRGDGLAGRDLGGREY
jgi:hypothetical protein